MVTPQFDFLMSSKIAAQLLLHLMTKEYNSQAENKNETFGNDGGFVEVELLVDLLTEVMMTLSCCTIDDRFLQELSRDWNMVTLMQQILRKYFLPQEHDILELTAAIKSKDEAKLTKRFKLLTEMIWLTNNIVAHEHNNSVALQAGLDKTYYEIVQCYSQMFADMYGSDLSSAPFTGEFW